MESVLRNAVPDWVGRNLRSYRRLIGGVISSPIVGATYHPNLAIIGLWMAILGNILGTYLGLLTAVLARALI